MSVIRTVVFVGTSLTASYEEQEQAVVLAQRLWKQNYLPVMPFLYQFMFQAEGSDYATIRLMLLAGCTAAIYFGAPPDAELQFISERAIAMSTVPQGDPS